MTTRLKTAIERLAPDELEQVTALAEALANRHQSVEGDRPLKLTWVGCLADGPDSSGLEAQRRANAIRLQLLDKNLKDLNP